MKFFLQRLEVSYNIVLAATFMKPLLIIGIISVIFFSCKKKKTYLIFTDKQLIFVNYSKAQNLKFFDTANILQTLTQDK